MIIFTRITGPDGKPYASVEELENWLEEELKFCEANKYEERAETTWRLLYTLRRVKS